MSPLSLTSDELRYLEGLVRAGHMPSRWSDEDRQALANKLIAIRVRDVRGELLPSRIGAAL